MDSVYTIPVIAQDLRQEENIVQIADTLEHLNRVIDDIFGRIDRRIDDNIVRTRSIAKRISVCSGKVDKLTGMNKATKVFSSSKYPGMDCLKNYESLYSHEGNGITMERTGHEIKSKPLIAIDKDQQEKLEFYHVKIAQPDARRTSLDSRPSKGLGPLPSNAPSIGCLLLFGTGETVYGATERALGQPRGQMPLVQAIVDTALDAAPFSMSNREKGAGKAVDTYMYSPGMGEVPEMDVPRDLPHLPGVAGDLQFLSEGDRVIAPSAAIATRPLEIFSETEQPKKQDVQQAAPVSTAENVKTVDPPKPEVIVKKVEEPVAVKKLEVQEGTGGAPPPPPMPMPPAPFPPPIENLTEPDSAKKGAQSTSVTKKIGAAPSGMDDRANLMEAIRNAGGLKKAKLRNADDIKTVKSAKPGGTGGDLMADLHAKLSMRRKGISGNRSIMEAMSAMIDRPILNADNVSNSSASSSAEDEWE